VVVPSVLQGSQVLHLKSAVTQMDEHSLLIPTGKAGDQLLAAMQATARGYNVYRLPNMLSCNVIACNGVIFAQDNTSCVQSRRTLEKAVLERSMDLMFVDTSELAKKDAALTCCSISWTFKWSNLVPRGFIRIVNCT
jgi:dimethylargininase